MTVMTKPTLPEFIYSLFQDSEATVSELRALADNLSEAVQILTRKNEELNASLENETATRKLTASGLQQVEAELFQRNNDFTDLQRAHNDLQGAMTKESAALRLTQKSLLASQEDLRNASILIEELEGVTHQQQLSLQDTEKVNERLLTDVQGVKEKAKKFEDFYLSVTFTHGPNLFTYPKVEVAPIQNTNELPFIGTTNWTHLLLMNENVIGGIYQLNGMLIADLRSFIPQPPLKPQQTTAQIKSELENYMKYFMTKFLQVPSFLQDDKNAQQRSQSDQDPVPAGLPSGDQCESANSDPANAAQSGQSPAVHNALGGEGYVGKRIDDPYRVERAEGAGVPVGCSTQVIPGLF